MNIEVKYLSGSGNLFTVIDNRKYNFDKDFFHKNAIALTSSNDIFSKSTEGVIILNESNNYHFDVWFFNPDGSTGMMCGNGGRCAIQFALEQNFVIGYKDEQIISFEMNNRVYKGFKKNNIYAISFSAPEKISDMQEISIDDKIFSGRYINVGNDHFIINVEEIDNFDVESWGKKIRFHEAFFPNGVNVSFYSQIDATTLKIRTYERGVEKETGACGTGSIATAIAYCMDKQPAFPEITLIPTSCLKLIVNIVTINSQIREILLAGEVHNLANGNLKLN